mmetsp:Transcript_60539/g.83068  ORF Transcript_60539/g.83068 Transcript_60539/m.83068 type:complete len:144 (-) Transcript_60539:275-706(-)
MTKAPSYELAKTKLRISVLVHKNPTRNKAVINVTTPTARSTCMPSIQNSHIRALIKGLGYLQNPRKEHSTDLEVKRVISSTQCFLQKMRTHRLRHATVQQSCCGCRGIQMLKTFSATQLKSAYLSHDLPMIQRFQGIMQELDS